jgi:D-glycero-D-manno-heptose 1,7-bisphosphate phosphatase
MVLAWGCNRWLYLSHHPDLGHLSRKPLPGMLEQSVSDFSLDLARSYLVGDKLSDTAAGRAAGCRCFLVRTRYGGKSSEPVPEDVTIVDDLWPLPCVIRDSQRG